MTLYHLGAFSNLKSDRVKCLINWMALTPEITKKIPTLSDAFQLNKRSQKDLFKAFKSFKK